MLVRNPLITFSEYRRPMAPNGLWLGAAAFAAQSQFVAAHARGLGGEGGRPEEGEVKRAGGLARHTAWAHGMGTRHGLD
jgi:hypothetical protein